MSLFKSNKKEIGESILKLKPATMIEIFQKKDGETSVFTSKLIEVLSEEEIVMIPPKDDTGLVKLHSGVKYKVRFKTSSGLLENDAELKSYDLDGGMQILKLKLTGVTKKIQRRESFRLNIELMFNFDVIENINEEELKSDKELTLKGKTIDISSGGIKFITLENLEIDTNIKVLLNIENLFIVALGTIIHKEEIEHKKKIIYSYKCRFETIPKRYQEGLSKYIFDTQRELSKKGKIGN